MNSQQIAEAFSSHRFADVYDSLAPTVRWVIPGATEIAGKPGVVAACEKSMEELNALERTEFTRFVSVGGSSVAAVDAVGRYVNSDGTSSVVSSADIYELDGAGMVITITSYAVELQA